MALDVFTNVFNNIDSTVNSVIVGKTANMISIISPVLLAAFVVDEAALVDALQQQKIFAAGLDVYAQEPLSASTLFDLPNVVTVPHIGSATAETRHKMAQLAYQNLVDALDGKTPRYLVNPKF